MEILDFGPLAGLDKSLANIPTMQLLKLRWVLAEVSRFSRKEIIAFPVTRQAPQFFHSASGKGNYLGVVVFGNWNFYIRKSSIQMHLPPGPCEYLGFPHRREGCEYNEGFQLRFTFAGGKQPPLLQVDEPRTFSFSQLGNGGNRISVVLAALYRV